MSTTFVLLRYMICRASLSALKLSEKINAEYKFMNLVIKWALLSIMLIFRSFLRSIQQFTAQSFLRYANGSRNMPRPAFSTSTPDLLEPLQGAFLASNTTPAGLYS